MPIMSSLGALTYTKISEFDQYWWAGIQSSNTGNIQCFGYFAVNQSDIISIGSRKNPNNQYNNLETLNLTNYLGNLPYIVSQNSYELNPNANSSSGGTLILLNNEENVYYIFGRGINNVGATQSLQQVKKIAPNNSVIATYFDAPPSASNIANRILTDGLCNGANNYVTVGYLQQSGLNVNFNHTYISTYTDTTRNAGKLIQYANTRDQTNNLLVVDTNSDFYVKCASNVIVKIEGNLGNIINQRSIVGTNNFNDLIIDNNDDLYFGASNTTIGGSNITLLCKFDTSSNVISWSKSSSYANANSVTFNYLYLDNSNLYCLGWPSPYQASEKWIQILNVDANTGNINFQRRIEFSGTGNYSNLDKLYLTHIEVINEDLYIGGSQQAANLGFINHLIKLPKDGTIFGNGNYTVISGNNNLYLNYTNTSVTIGNTTPSIATSNVTLITANSSTITSNTPAATSQSDTLNTYAFNSP